MITVRIVADVIPRVAGNMQLREKGLGNVLSLVEDGRGATNIQDSSRRLTPETAVDSAMSDALVFQLSENQ